MNKNPMDLARKINKYQQWVKISRRGLQVRIDNPQSQNPDFALGAYPVKPSSEYAFLINTELPKGAEYLEVDFYGLNSQHHPQHHLKFLNRGRVYQHHRDIRLNFYTYPKTRYIFMTVKMIFPNENHRSQYQINYLFLESKTPIARGTETPQIPNSFELEYQIECSPRVIQEIDLSENEFLKEFQTMLPINLDLFEHSMIHYLLQKELSPHYLESLINNLKASHRIKSTQPLSQFRQVQRQELINLQDEIKKASDKLEKFMVKVDTLTNQKASLEINLGQEDTQTFAHQDLLTNIKVHQEMEKSLNLKYHHLKSLEHSHLSYHENSQHPNLESPSSTSAILELIVYYQSRVLNDLEIVKEQLQKLILQEERMNHDVIQPQDKSHQRIENDLDETLLEYRKSRKTCLVLKAHLDEKISKFISLFYHFLHQQNYRIYS